MKTGLINRHVPKMRHDFNPRTCVKCGRIFNAVYEEGGNYIASPFLRMCYSCKGLNLDGTEKADVK